MAACSKAFEFDIGDEVMLTPIRRPARVISLRVDSYGPQYFVTYWNDSKRETECVFATELCPLMPPGSVIPL